MLTVSDPELRALAEGESVVIFAPRGAVTEGDELELAGAGPLEPGALKPAYRRWADTGPPQVPLSAVAVSVDPAGILDPEAGAARYILANAGEGDVVVLRVFDPDGPVLGDEGFAARRRSVEGALRQ